MTRQRKRDKEAAPSKDSSRQQPQGGREGGRGLQAEMLRDQRFTDLPAILHPGEAFPRQFPGLISHQAELLP